MNTDTQVNFICSKCGESKKVDDFYISKQGKRTTSCKSCCIEHMRAYNNTTLKQCSTCREERPLRMFPMTRQRPFRRTNKCRACTESGATRNNPRKPESSENRKSRIAMKKKVFLLYFKTHPCVDCGETNPVVLDFDHRDPDDKEFTISQGLGHSFSLHRLMVEIEKCDVRCANCHRKRTAKQAGWNWAQILEADLKETSPCAEHE